MAFGKTHRWVLAGILLVALALRVWGVGFGLPYANARPDETSVAGPAVTFLSGDLEPPHFLYPTFFMYALSGVYAGYYEVTRPWAPYKTLHDFAESRRQNLAPFLLVSRSISVVMGVLTVLWLYLLGARTAGRSAALLAAAFLAVSFLHVRDSHFGVTDVTMTGLVVLAVYLIVKWQESGAVSAAAMAGVAGGFAMGVKYNGLGAAVPFAAAAIDRIVAGLRERRSIAAVFVAGVVFAIVFAAIFLAGSFYIFIQPARFLHDVTLQGQTLTEGHGMALPRGWIYHAIVTLPAAIGWPMYLAGAAGMIWRLVTGFRRAIVVFAFPIAYYIVAGNGHTVFARYMLPVIPFLCLAAGWCAARIVELAILQGSASRRHAATALVGVLVALPTSVKSIQIDRLLTRTDNRVIVANAIETIVPHGATIYHSGAAFGKIQFPASLQLHEAGYDERPEWMLVQRSPLQLYSEIPPQVTKLIESDYTLVRAFPVGDDRPRVYDPQDAFFLPLAGLEGIERPGPSFELYRKRSYEP